MLHSIISSPIIDPSIKCILDTSLMIRNTFLETRKYIMQLLSNSKYVSFSADFWTGSDQKSILNIDF